MEGNKTQENEPTKFEGGGAIHQIRQSLGILEKIQNILSTFNHVVGTMCETATTEGNTSYEAEKRRCYRTMENHLYTCVYEILRSDIPPEHKRAHLNRYKSEIMPPACKTNEGGSTWTPV
jgi:hypothetical protein